PQPHLAPLHDALPISGMHDLGALWASIRNRGQSIGALSGRYIGPRGRNLFLVVIFLLLLMVNAAFSVVIANLLIATPTAVIPTWGALIVAFLVGQAIYRYKWSLPLVSVVGVVALYTLIVIGDNVPLARPGTVMGLDAKAAWIILLFVYAGIASMLPVWMLLQPRDYINGLQLFIALGILYGSVLLARPEIVAPAYNSNVPEGTPNLVPLLFVTIACGAISGFHGLVSSGTSSKQLDRETDARFVGYFGAIGEGMLAVASVMATAAGFATFEAWSEHYATWASASGGGTPAFVLGAGNLISNLGIPAVIGTTFISIMVVAFAATTLDTSMRLQRFILSEIGEQYNVPFLKNMNFSTVLVFLTCVALAFLADPSNPGSGGMVLWPLFGTTNQLTAGLSLIVLALLLWRMGRPVVYVVIPLVFVVTMTTASMVYNIMSYVQQGNILLVVVGTLVLALNVWLILEGMLAARRESNRPDIPSGPPHTR